MYTVAFLIRRKPGLSRDEFLEYYEQKHGPRMVELAKDRGLVSYEHFPAELPSDAPAGTTTPDAMFDGFSIYAFETKAQADACWARPEVLADGEAFIDMDQMVKLVVSRRHVFGGPERKTQ